MCNNQVHYKSEIHTCAYLIGHSCMQFFLAQAGVFVLLSVFAELRMAQQMLEKLVNSGVPFIMRD